MQLILWLLRYTIGWARDIWPANIKSTAILFDRYYHDVLVDPRRYRYGGPTWWARALGWLVPKPDLWILLDAPADVLQARKTEVPAQESERQRRAYVALVESFDNGIVIDSSNPLDDVRREATRGILEFMAHRTEDRLGLGFSSPPPHSTGVAP
jgi:thymidylate kinase